MQALTRSLAGVDFSTTMKGLSLRRRPGRMRPSDAIQGDTHNGGNWYFVGTMYGNSLLVAEEASSPDRATTRPCLV